MSVEPAARQASSDGSTTSAEIATGSAAPRPPPQASSWAAGQIAHPTRPDRASDRRRGALVRFAVRNRSPFPGPLRDPPRAGRHLPSLEAQSTGHPKPGCPNPRSAQRHKGETADRTDEAYARELLSGVLLSDLSRRKVPRVRRLRLPLHPWQARACWEDWIGPGPRLCLFPTLGRRSLSQSR